MKNPFTEPITLKESGKLIRIFIETSCAPLVILHAGEQEGDGVWAEHLKKGGTPFNLAVIEGLDWEGDLSPWPSPALYKKAPPFTGGADPYLSLFTEKLLPEILRALPENPPHIILAGYSLAGMFSIYASTRLSAIDGIVSASGSLWYPDFMDYMAEHPVPKYIEAIYLSLGDREAKTRNPVMAAVADCTLAMRDMLIQDGRNVTFEWNPGGHFQDDSLRLYKGILWTVDALTETPGD